MWSFNPSRTIQVKAPLPNTELSLSRNFQEMPDGSQGVKRRSVVFGVDGVACRRARPADRLTIMRDRQ
jgi:hypothetical protein